MNTLKVYYDSDVENPREFVEYDSVIAYKSQYTLGEEIIPEPIDWLEEKLNVAKKYEYSNARLAELEEIFFDRFIAKRIYLYDHSSLAVSTSPFSNKWDSGQVGYIYISKEKVRANYGAKKVGKKLKQLVLDNLEAEVEELNHYVSGEVFGFKILDSEGSVVDSCWGFYGDNFLENGMLDNIDTSLLGITDEELKTLLKTIEPVFE